MAGSECLPVLLLLLSPSLWVSLKCVFSGTETIPEMGDGERCIGQVRVLAVRKFAGATYLWTRCSFLYCLCFVIFGCAAGAIAEDVFIFI